MSYKSTHSKSEFNRLMQASDDFINKNSGVDSEYESSSQNLVDGKAVTDALLSVMNEFLDNVVPYNNDKLFVLTAYSAVKEGNKLYIE